MRSPDRKWTLCSPIMAPNLSGIAATDQARALELAELALDFALKHLKPQGNFLVKVFQGAAFEGFLKNLRSRFRRVTVRKPEASRSRSSEVYLLAKRCCGKRETWAWCRLLRCG